MTFEERFWAKVLRGGPEECWNWTAALDHAGYGIIGTGGQGQTGRAHRISAEWALGPIPNGLCVLHRCDNPRCVNPAHLFYGTRADNLKDMAQKGRASKGEARHNAVITADMVREMRRRAAGSPRGTIARLAREYGVSYNIAWRVINGLHWRHVV